ncbi:MULTISPECIES: hypothetical protein [Niallia]|jgi:hypothetical protein|nr:hypothetical protein [Niallia circulans]
MFGWATVLFRKNVPVLLITGVAITGLGIYGILAQPNATQTQ